MSTRPRIGMVVFRSQPEIGGIESHVAEVAPRLAELGFDLEVLTSDRSALLPAVERIDGYLVRRFPTYPATRDWYFSPGVFGAARSGGYDLLHIQGVHSLVPPLGMLAAAVDRTPFLVTLHTGGTSSTVRQRLRGAQFRTLSPLLRRAARVVGVSQFEATRFEQLLGRPAGSIQVIRNGGSLPSVGGTVEVDPARVLSVGRLERYKGHHRVIEALPRLAESMPGAHVEVLGSGPYASELRALADQLGVGDRVEIRFIPPPDRRLMAQTMARAAVVALLSDYEAHPVAVMEALTIGRPAVVSRTSGLTELADLGWAVGVEHDAGPAETARALEQQMTTPLLPDPVELPTWDTCANGLARAYEEVLQQRTSPGTLAMPRWTFR